MDIDIRKGVKQDLPQVLALIKELADYEKSLDQVDVTLEQLEQDGFDGHPLRKDFPLTGFNEVRYSEKDKKVIYEKVKLEQDYRKFDFDSPWEGTKYIDEIKNKEKQDG